MLKPKFGNKMDFQIIAISILIGLYLEEVKFKQQYLQITGVYHAAISYYVLTWINSHKAVLLAKEYKVACEKLKECLKVKITNEDIDLCILELDELAWNWSLRLPKPLAGLMFFIRGLVEELKSSGITTVKVGPGFHPAINAAPLQLTIHDWVFTELGQLGVQEQIKKSLKHYNQELYKKGISAFPYGIEQHAGWWFAHYVQNKPYKQIGEECYIDPETVKRKVWDFRKLLHISLK